MSLFNHIRTEPNRHSELFTFLQEFYKVKVPHFSAVRALIIGNGARPFGYEKAEDKTEFMGDIVAQMEKGELLPKFETYEPRRYAKLFALRHTPSLMVIDEKKECVDCVPMSYTFDFHTGAYNRHITIPVTKLRHNITEALPLQIGKFDFASMLVVADRMSSDSGNWNMFGNYFRSLQEDEQAKTIKNVDKILRVGGNLVVTQGKTSPVWSEVLEPRYEQINTLQLENSVLTLPPHLQLWHKKEDLKKIHYFPPPNASVLIQVSDKKTGKLVPKTENF